MSDQWRRYWDRGHVFEWYVYRQFAAKYGDQAVEYQRVIPWGRGWEAHGDIYLRPQRTMVEVKSSTVPSGHSTLIEDAILQVQMQVIFDAEAEAGIVYLVNPNRLDREEAIPVRVTDEARHEVAERVASLERALDGGDLPACACDTPTACRWKGCPYTDVAWEGWTPPEPVSLDLPAFAAQELWSSEIAVRNAKDLVKAAEAVREEKRAAVRDQLAPGVEYEADGVKVKRVEVSPRHTFSYAAAVKAGMLDPGGPLGEFVRVGEAHDRWYVTGSGSPELVEDFGEEAPF